MKRLFFSLLLLVLASDAPAQQARQYVYRHITAADGLSSNLISTMLQDSRGYMWLASHNGLQRYDGNRFITISHQPGGINRLPNDYVGMLYEDSRGRLWVATGDNKLGILDMHTFEYREVPVQWKQPHKIYRTKRLVELNGNLVLFSHETGIYRFDSTRFTFEPADDILHTPAGWDINTVVNDTAAGKIWMSSYQGLLVYNKTTGNTNYRGHNPDNEPVIRNYGDHIANFWLHLDRKQRLIFINWPPKQAEPHVFMVDKVSGRGRELVLSHTLPLGYHEVTAPLEQANGRLWFYGYPFVASYTEDTLHPFEMLSKEYVNEQSIKFDRVEKMYEDREHNLWMASDNGLWIFNPDAEVFKSYTPQRYGKPATEVNVQAICQLQNGQLWVGAWAGNMFFYDSAMNPIPPPPGFESRHPLNMVWSIREQRDGKRVWFGLQDGNLLVYDHEKKKSTYLQPEILANSTIREISEDPQGNMWLGTQRGRLVKWDRTAAGNDVTKGYIHIQDSGLVHRLFCDNEGYMWAGCMGFGCYRFDPRTNKRVLHVTADGPEGKRLYENTPHDFVQYNDSIFLISTGALNIVNIKTGAVRIVTTEDGLPSNTVYGMVKDKQGDIWLGLSNGLCRFNYEKNIFTLYDRRDGISFDNLTAIGATGLPDGRVAFATDHNFLLFDPARMLQSGPPPDVTITGFMLENEGLPVDSLLQLSDVSLAYDNTSIAINFSAMVFRNPQKITYYYQLEGADKDWVKADSRQQAIYNWLAPGDYTFRVKSQSADGVFSKGVTTIRIHVNAPFWRTWWFYGALALLAAGILYWIDRERVKRILGLQKVRSQIADNLHTAVNTTLNNINLLSEMAKIKADKDMQLSREYVEQISEKSREMIDAMDDMLWSIQPENDSMRKTLLRMNEFSDGLQSSHGVRVKMAVDDRVAQLSLDMKTRQDIYFLFKDALNYISQYAEGTTVLVNMDLVKSRFLLKIHAGGPFTVVEAVADQRYFEAMQQHAAQLAAILDIQSDKRGISIILQLPVR